MSARTHTLRLLASLALVLLVFTTPFASADVPQLGPEHLRAIKNALPNLDGLIVGDAALELDVAQSMTLFRGDEGPVDENGLPAYGNPFVIQGYIYPGGTLGASDGILPDGSAEYPELVIGRWVCRGWIVGDEGLFTFDAPFVISHQYYQLGDDPSAATFATDGFEMSVPGTTLRRAIIGGTGPFRRARGEIVQMVLGFNATRGDP